MLLKREQQCADGRIAHEKHPHIRLRILLTQGSYSTNDKVLAVVPPEVSVTYYDGGRTYNSSRDPMSCPLLTDYAAKGLRLGCYPQLTASSRIVCPWSGPQFVRFRMIEFGQKGLKCLCGYGTPNNRFYDVTTQTVTCDNSWSLRPNAPHFTCLRADTRRQACGDTYVRPNQC